LLGKNFRDLVSLVRFVPLSEFIKNIILPKKGVQRNAVAERPFEKTTTNNNELNQVFLFVVFFFKLVVLYIRCYLLKLVVLWV
jgi:hypothetical protein